MDNDFETPLVIQVQEEKPLDCAKGFRKFGGMLMDTLTSPPSEGASDAPPPLKKKTGFFGIRGETVQLEDEDAHGRRRNVETRGILTRFVT